MPTSSNLYQFPYSNNQVLISSGGVIVHSKDDTVMLFGKSGVGISTPKEFHVDAPERTIINSNKIELGIRAEQDGYSVIKGQLALDQFDRLFDTLSKLGAALEKIAVEGFASAVPDIQRWGGDLKNTANSVKQQLRATALSDVTYTN
tara:strand:+ start:123 stop:563 length:441 start_codon:yes stop_codon:yes gene_type:complete